MKGNVMVDAPKPMPDAKAGLKRPDDDGDLKPKKMKPAGSGIKALGRALIVASLFIMIAWVFSAVVQPRYVLAPVQTNENTFIYRLDQRTGVVHLCGTQQCTELPVR